VKRLKVSSSFFAFESMLFALARCVGCRNNMRGFEEGASVPYRTASPETAVTTHEQKESLFHTRYVSSFQFFVSRDFITSL
jgi:hypothetical protein